MANIDTNAYLEDASASPVAPNVRVFRHALGASDEPSADDHLRFFKMPKNAKIAYASFAATDLDSGAGAIDVDLILSDGSTDKILSEGTGAAVPAATGVRHADKEPGLGFVTDSNDWYVALDWKVVASTFAAGTVTVAIIYTLVLDNGA